MTVDELAQKALEKCEQEGWPRTWDHAGCVLHLEVSEFIEALRGKGNSTVMEEAGDVMFVLFSTLAARGIKPSEALEFVRRKIET